MKRNTRQEILHTAKALFNEKGYNGVSTRDIAAALGIAKGNLSYYFKRKEEIMEALLAESAQRAPLRSPRSLAELDAFFADIEEAVAENAFYFWHHAQLGEVSPQIREQQNAVYRGNVAKLRDCFTVLAATGLLRQPDFPGEYGRVIDTLLLSSVYWVPFCVLKQQPLPETSFRLQAWSILHPLLSDDGHKSLENLVKFE